MMHPRWNRSNIGFRSLSILKKDLFSIADVYTILVSE